MHHSERLSWQLAQKPSLRAPWIHFGVLAHHIIFSPPQTRSRLIGSNILGSLLSNLREVALTATNITTDEETPQPATHRDATAGPTAMEVAIQDDISAETVPKASTSKVTHQDASPNLQPKGAQAATPNTAPQAITSIETASTHIPSVEFVKFNPPPAPAPDVVPLLFPSLFLLLTLFLILSQFLMLFLLLTLPGCMLNGRPWRVHIVSG